MPYMRCPKCRGTGKNPRLMPIQRGAPGIPQECRYCGGTGRVWEDEKIIVEHHYGDENEDYRDRGYRRPRARGGTSCLLPLLGIVAIITAVAALVFIFVL